MRIAIIPARGGSKRIHRKNIRLFHGKPIIAWSIEAALKSNCFDRVLVSTEDEEIASISERYGAQVPFLRPSRLADDLTSTGEVVRSSILSLQSRGVKPTHVCCIYATAPFISHVDLRSAYGELTLTGVDYVFSACSFSFPIQRGFFVDDSGLAKMQFPEMFRMRSQDLKPFFHDAAQFYWGTLKAWLDDRPIYDLRARPWFIPRTRVQDIDTEEDWKVAENLFSLGLNE